MVTSKWYSPWLGADGNANQNLRAVGRCSMKHAAMTQSMSPQNIQLFFIVFLEEKSLSCVSISQQIQGLFYDLGLQQKGSTNAIFWDRLMVTIAAISGSQTSLALIFYQLTKPLAHAHENQINIYSFHSFIVASPFQCHQINYQQPSFNKPQIDANSFSNSSRQHGYLVFRAGCVHLRRDQRHFCCSLWRTHRTASGIPKPGRTDLEEVMSWSN